MYFYQFICIIALLLSWKCNGYQSHLDKRLASSAKAHRSEEKLRLLKSLLESKAIEQSLQRASRWHLQTQASADEFEKNSKLRNSKTVTESLSDEVHRLNEDDFAKLAKTVLSSLISRSKRTARSVSQNRTLPVQESTIMNSTGDTSHEISGVSRLISFGYNLIRGCPGGEFENGGVDAGLRTSRPIFKFTFNQEKNDSHIDSSFSQPDQVVFEPRSDIAVVSSDNVYGGGKSYRDALTTGVSAAGNYKAFQFSGSETIASIHEEAMSTQTVFLEKRSMLTLGEVRHVRDDVNDITDEFYDAVMSLPISYFSYTLHPRDKQKYYDFFDEWGTDVIQRAEVGRKHIIRYRANYTSVYQFARTTCGSAIDAGDVGSGFVKMSIDKLNDMIEPTSQFGSYEAEMEFGSEEEPVPIKLYLEPIVKALEEKYWVTRLGDPNGNATASQLYNSLKIKRQLMKLQLRDYAEAVGSSLQDPDISIPIEWPQGTYSLPQTTSGCPANFSSGCRTQDNEDNNNQNQFSEDIHLALQGEFHNSNQDIQTCYCSKTEPGDSIFSWMPGQYCINRKKGSCPDGFSTGYIEWDDEDENNINTHYGELPDGEYPKGRTLIQYCCRDDGDPEDEIVLPNTQRFILYPHKEKVCQEVHGMEFEQHYIYTDDEDSDNQGRCVGEAPFVPNNCDGPDIKLTYCYYRPK